jgi:hypothetical protein
MALFQEIALGKATFANGSGLSYPITPSIIAGNATTRAAVIAEVDPALGIGSQYMSTQGKLYIKVASTATPATTDWQVVTQTAAD